MIEENIIKRIMPHSEEAELSVIGSMLMDRSAAENAAESLEREDFYADRNGVMFECLKELCQEGKPIDIVTFQDKMKEKDVPEDLQSLEYIKEILSTVPTWVNIKSYCEIVKEKSQLRRFIRTAKEIEEAAYGGNISAAEIAEETEKKVFEMLLRSESKDPVTVRDSAENALQEIEKASKIEGNITGVATGYKKLDELTGGLQNSDLIVIAARPSMGKTAFALNLLNNIALKDKKPCLLFSLEMSTKLVMNRFLSMDSRLESTKLRTGKLTDREWDDLVNSVVRVSKGNLKIDDTAGLTVSQIRSKCRKEKVRGGLSLIVIDYLQLMSSGRKQSENRQQEISEISRGLKALAKEMDCPVIALSQLSRAPETRADHRPMLADLRESGSIEQDADIVMFIYRDDYYTKEESDRPGETEVIIGKNRNGGLEDIRLKFDKATTKFYDIL